LKAKISNAQIAELLAREAGKSEGILARAYKKAARSAFLWPEYACDLLSNGRSLTELKGIGPFIARRLRDWLDRPPAKITPPLLYGHVGNAPMRSKIKMIKISVRINRLPPVLISPSERRAVAFYHSNLRRVSRSNGIALRSCAVDHVSQRLISPSRWLGAFIVAQELPW